jgi:hypothetical protein
VQLSLSPHPAMPPTDPSLKVWANVDHVAKLGPVATTNIWFGVSIPADRFILPEGEPARADELWQTTCFEAFLRAEGDGEAYREWNFAPSGQWAAYDFTAYREGRSNPDVAAPYLRLEDNFTWWSFGATITVDAETRWRLGLSAILEGKEGAKSYWALAHGGDKPDFHDPGCFAARLP